MALTKTQINYLENKLNRVVDEKKNQFVKDLGSTSLDQEVLKRLQTGKIKLLSKNELLSVFEERISKNNYYHSSFYIYELISKADKEEIETSIKARQELVNNYYNKLNAVKGNILDKIVLEGVDVDTALAELENIQ